jgi:ubiquinone/menaquinone biosynthesis C-methylase UbiE
MIDIPCGDANWIFDSYETDTIPLYVGLDVATNVLMVNKQRFAHHSNKQFHFWDATACEVPKFLNASSSNSIIKEEQQLLSSFLN